MPVTQAPVASAPAGGGRGAPSHATPGHPLLGARRSALGAYVALTKPRIIELLLVTTLPSMVLAAGGLPGWRVVAGHAWSAAPWRPAVRTR